MFKFGAPSGGVSRSAAIGGNGTSRGGGTRCILKIGGAGEWNLGGGGAGLRPSAGVEFSPFRNWPQIEAGVSPLFSGLVASSFGVTAPDVENDQRHGRADDDGAHGI